MHWTALLAYRRFPPSARVIDDLACIGCGYNLRGIRVGDRCPECGGQVGDSLFLLAKPEIAGRALNGIGKSFLAVFGIVIAIVSGATWAPMIATGVIAAGAVWRVIHAAELRYRAAVIRLPMIGMRVEVLWWCVVIDAIVSLAYLAIAILFVMNPIAFVTPLGLALVAWLITMLLCLAIAGWMGRPLAVMLGYGWMAVEFTVQRISVAASIGLAFVLLMGVAMAAPQTVENTCAAAFMLVFTWTVVATVITLLQLANAAHRSSDTLDDAIDVFAGDSKQAENNSRPFTSSPHGPEIPLARD